MNSCTEHAAMSRPRPITTSASAMSDISARRWLDTKTVRPWPARYFRKLRTHRMPSGSRPLAGSSSSSTCGSPSRAPAIPRRWRIPSENRPTAWPATSLSPTSPSTSPTRRAGRPFEAASQSEVVRRAAAGMHVGGVEQAAHLVQRPGKIVVATAGEGGDATVGGGRAPASAASWWTCPSRSAPGSRSPRRASRRR